MRVEFPNVGPVIIALAVAAAFIAKAIADGVVNYAKAQTRASDPHRLAELEERLRRIEQAVESVAIEVERIGEHQRFAARSAAAISPAEGAVASPPRSAGS
jgi:hypothetical protein